MKIKIIYTFSILLLLSLNLVAQEEGMIELVNAESELAKMFTCLYNLESNENKDSLCLSIVNKFEQALLNPLSYDYKWEKLDMIGKLQSDDQLLKVFTWYLGTPTDEFRYFGFIQLKEGKKGVVFPLQDKINGKSHDEMLKQTTTEWQGKLYYQLITNTHRRTSYYTLLGMDFSSALSRIKTIEVLTIQKGKPQFVGAMFSDGKKSKDRMVFEYSSQVSMSLRFNTAMQKIVFDHLAPFQPIYFGDFRFYGPDGSYDALYFKDGQWIFEEDVDARNY